MKTHGIDFELCFDAYKALREFYWPEPLPRALREELATMEIVTIGFLI